LTGLVLMVSILDYFEIIWIDVAPSETCIKTLIGIKAIAKVLDVYKNSNGKYPGNEVGLSVLVKASKNNQVYLNKVPSDGWGKHYIYRYPSSLNKQYDYDLYSSGENKIDDSGNNDDIHYWEPFGCPEPTKISKITSRISSILLYIWLPLALFYFFDKLLVKYIKRKT